MNNLIDNLEDLQEEEMMSIEGGKFLDKSFGYDVRLATFCHGQKGFRYTRIE